MSTALVLPFALVLLAGLSFAQKPEVTTAHLTKMIFEGWIGHRDLKGTPYRITQSTNYETFIVEFGGNQRYRAVTSGPGGRAPVGEAIRVGEMLYERRDGGPWTSTTLAEYRSERAKVGEEMKAALAQKDNKRYKDLQSFYNLATTLVMHRIFLGIHTLSLNFPKDTVVKKLDSKTLNDTYQTTGSYKFDSPAAEVLPESRFDHQFEFDSSGMLVAARLKDDWIYVNRTTVTHLSHFKWELNPGITIVAPI